MALRSSRERDRPPSPRTPLRRSQAKRDRSLFAIAAAALVLMLLVGVGIGAYVLSRKSAVAIDPQSLCPVDRPPAEAVALVLDMSDRLAEVQLLSVRNHLTRLLYGALPRFAYVEVYAVQDRRGVVAEPVIAICNPGNGADLSPIYQNPGLARQRWETDFAAALSSKLNELLARPDSASSPIYEAIQAVAVRFFGKPDYDGVPKRLIVVSDLLQNVPSGGAEGSHYRGVPDFDAFRAGAYFSQVRADLSGVRVDLFYMNRSDRNIQGAEHIRFWESYFRTQGATVMSVERIFGD